MPLYEHVFLARQDASPQQVEELTTQMTGIVEQGGGKVVKTESWGVRSLTYRMNKNRKAHFVLLNIDAPSAVVAEIERQERISEDVLRYLTVRVEDRLQGFQAVDALRLRARQDRAEPHHRGLRQEAARARPRHQARAFPWPLALRNPLTASFRGARIRERTRNLVGFHKASGSF